LGPDLASSFSPNHAATVESRPTPMTEASMERSEAISTIGAALISSGAIDDANTLTEDDDLIGDGLIDSLDAMMFLFELEKALGRKITTIDESYEDFTVRGLADAIIADATGG
jgi:acyl carrier protein